MSMLLFMLHRLWSIINDSDSVVSSIVSLYPALLSFHMLAGNLDRARLSLLSRYATQRAHHRARVLAHRPNQRAMMLRCISEVPEYRVLPTASRKARSLSPST